MSKLTISRELQFDAGHRVLGHENKCSQLHGHRYRAIIEMESGRLDSIGRVIDFGVVKTWIGDWIDDNWDHNMLLHVDDPLLDMIRQLSKKGIESEEHIAKKIFGRFKKPYIMESGNPTAENMACDLFAKGNGVLKAAGVEGIDIVSVTIYETPNCFAVYRG